MTSKESGERILRVVAAICDVDKGKCFRIQSENCDFTEEMPERDLLDLLRDCVEVRVEIPKIE
jgi:hypothetical protein